MKLLFIHPKEDKKRDTSQDRWMTVQIRFEKCTVSNSHLEISISYYARILPVKIGTCQRPWLSKDLEKPKMFEAIIEFNMYH